MVYKSLLAHYNENQSSYSIRMFLIGFATNVHMELMFGFTEYLYISYD